MRKLQGIVVEIERTGEYRERNGEKWEKCIFTVELIGFSKRTPHEKLPESLKGAKVKIIRWCCYDWHYKISARTTLTPKETERVLKGELDLTK
ncbi:MAG: hypothetical protein DRJ52_01220 [Thermoprotei archaeon]|nr:MAG: hypothetical protein DRJ52_01220 [Thermoprotei archaeon]RLF01181.1 MAG: hypothetical protein DRJ63_00320 [Thermoprotei archaeon]HDI74378.1 hypothetical protein [Thermoprotei archaeon]